MTATQSQPDPNVTPPNIPTPASRRTGWLIFAIAAVMRLLYLVDASDAPTFATPIVDAGTYCELARSALITGTLDPAFFWQPFFYPAFLTAAFAVSGKSLLFAKLLQALLGAATCLLTYQLACRVLAARWATVAGLITAFYGPLIFFDSELVGTGWETFWTAALLLCVLDARAAAKPRVWARLGFVAGFCILSRPTFLPFVVIALVWSAIGLVRAPAPRLRAVARALAVLILTAILPLIPASLMSHRGTDSYSILPYSGGLNLYIGNNPSMDQTIAIRPGWQWDSITMLPARHGIRPGRETSTFFALQARQYAITMPVAFIKGLITKTVQCVSSRELPRNEDIYLYHDWSILMRLLVWHAGPFGFPFGLLLPLALLGLFHLGRRVPFPLYAFLLIYTATIILVFPSARYRMPLIPILAIAAAAGLAALVAWWPTQRRRALTATGGIALTALLISLPGPYPQERASFRAEMLYCLAGHATRQGQDAAAVPLLRDAIAVSPHYADAHNSLGVALERIGNSPAALAAYADAITHHPGLLTARMNLANLLYRGKDYAAAMTEYRAVAARSESHKESRKSLAMCLIFQERTADAIPWLYAALMIDPNDAGVHNNLGSALNATGKPEEALKHFQSAILLDPDLDLAVENFGSMLIGHGHLDKARILYRAALTRAASQQAPDRVANFQTRLNALE